jgi:hypothetical protein
MIFLPLLLLPLLGYSSIFLFLVAVSTGAVMIPLDVGDLPSPAARLDHACATLSTDRLSPA